MRYISYFFCAAFMLCGWSVSAQKIKYRDLVPALDTASISEQMSMLKTYLIDDLDHGNANFRIAMLHYNVFRKADPLLEYTKAVAHAKEAMLRLTKAKVVVTAQDVRSDNEYYAPFFKTVDSKGRPAVEFPVVQQKLILAFDSVQKFLVKMPPIYSAFTKSVQFYDQSVKKFADINTEFRTLEDIYMFFDDDLNSRFESLKNQYDSSLTNFKKYLALTEEYSLPKYKQKFHIKPINVYRLDGLTTKLTFLEKDVEFWNYAEWVERVRKTYNDEIKPIKERIAASETKLDESLKTLAGGTANTPYKLSKDLIFQLNNYDKNSLALALLEYKAFKQNWLQKVNQISRDTAIDSKLELYSQLIQLNRGADSLAQIVKTKTNSFNTKKHSTYLAKYYGGADGLDKFLKSENEYIAKAFAEYQEVLKTDLLAYKPTQDMPSKSVKIGAFNVPLFVDRKPTMEMDLLNLYTQRLIRTPDGSLYVAGVHKTNKKTNNNLTAYVARINPDGKAAWLKELNFAPDSTGVLDADNYLGDLVSTQEGCAVVVTSLRAATGNHVNNFVFISDKGDVKNYKIKETGMARKLIYQEASNSFVMIFKGTKEKQQYQEEEKVSVNSINILGDLLWHQDLTFAGTVQDVITVRDGYILSGNYTIMKDVKGRESRTRINQGQSNPYLAKISLKGDILNVLPLTSDKSIYIDKIVKVNDGSINLLGYESTFNVMDDPNAAKGAVLHMMTAYDLKPICSNFN